MKASKGLRKSKKNSILAPLVVLFIILALWESLTRLLNIPRTVFPPFSSIIIKTINNFSVNIWSHVLVTVRTVLLGMIIAIPLGIFLAAIFSQFKLLQYGMTPVTLILVVTPMITLVPLFMLWMGFDYEPRFIVVVVQCSPIILLNTLTGFLQTPTRYIELMKGYGSSKLKTFIKVVFPNALPQVFTGVKLGCIFSTIATTSIEMVAGQPGLGYRVTYFSSQVQTELVFGCIICIALIGLLLYTAVDLIEKRVVTWIQ
jgi:ABC-type nitrate/sulfonate/bicarbonate transport system permease component